MSSKIISSFFNNETSSPFRIIDESDSNFNYRTIDMGRAGEISFNEFTDTIKIKCAEPDIFDELLPVNLPA